MENKRKRIARRQWYHVAGIALLLLLGFTAKPHAAVAAKYATINGAFKIYTNVKNGMTLDIAGGSGKNCANIQIYQVNNSGAQQFNITHVGSGWHKISHVQSGKLLDVTGGKQENNVNVQLYQDNGTPAQLWRFIPASNGYYRIETSKGFRLDVAGGKQTNGTNVCIYEKNTSNAQLWKPIRITLPTSISLSTRSATLTRIGQTQKITANIAPSNATEKNITWSTSEARVATVSNGIVTAKGSGKAVITAQTSNGKATSATIEVKDGCANISDGLYTLSSGVGKHMMLDVAGNQTVNGSNVQIYKNNNGMAQKFYVKKAGFGWYVIYNAYPNKCLDVKNGIAQKGANVQLYDQNNSAAQMWRFYSAENGYYCLMNQLGFYLDVAAGIAQNTTNVQIWKGNGTSAQQWKLTTTKADFLNIAEGLYNISTRLDSNMMLDVTSNGTEDGTNIQIYKKNPGIAQKFYIKNAGGNWYTISNPFSKKNLDVAGGKPESKTNVHLYEPNSSDAQRWRFCLAIDKKHLKIKSKVGKNFFLDVFEARKTNGGNVNIWSGNDTEAQQWKLHKTSIIELTGIKFNVGSLSLNKGQTKKLSVTYMPANATAANSKLSWSTSNGGVATVSENGEVRAVGAGTATITAKSYNDKIASITVNVIDTSSIYDVKVNAFINNSKWRHNAVWGSRKSPTLSNYRASGCCAYAADFIKYVFDFNVSAHGFGNRTFRNPSEIRAGDVIKVINKEHWFVVLYKNGNQLTTAEGNYPNGKVTISSHAYTLKGNTLYRGSTPFRTFDIGYHFRDN